MSAFGFGGINAQILVESYEAGNKSYSPVTAQAAPEKSVPCAIVGLGLISGAAHCAGDFSELIFGRKTPAGGSGESRWRRADHLPPDIRSAVSLFLDELTIDLKDFNIPPNQMNRILPQHLIMLKTALAALADAGIPARPEPSQPAPLEHGLCRGH